MRWRGDHPQDPLEEDISICAPPDLAGRERAETVARAVGMLPPMQREAVILFEYEEMSLEEIARATDAEIAAVKSRLSRARTNLRRMLAPLMEKGTAYGNK
jgi:DNA-directed RNA polymerase specialized sigma24 family protein